ncbi:MAG: phenylalanine--tRNA ligase subunit beta, partial [Candidatus Zixiibacteriota bacterium]
MQISYNWLKELVNFDLDPHQLAEKLTSIGTAVESVEPVAAGLDNVVVAKVVACDPHPAKDNLKVCRVELGRDIQMTVVCGAPNVRIGMKAALALPGAKLAGDLTVQSVDKFGVLSEGVLCSQAELGLSDDHSGLMEIDPAIKSGADLKTALNLEDHVLSFDLTPNRADCLSAIGIAREISVIVGSPIKRPAVEIKESSDQAATQVEIVIDDLEGCPRYAARVIRAIKIGRSPWWMQQRLLASGVRCINNIVDIGNYVMLEYGQPLHAFDFDNFSQPKVVVKRAAAGESFTTLDGVERKLSEDVLLITDGNTPVAIGGIMGGQFSEVSDKTTNLLLEGAYFNPSIIRRGRKHLGLTSEAQTRFERGADPNIISAALDRAASLIEKYAGGKVASGIVDFYPNRIEPIKLELRPTRVNQILKTEMSSPTMIDILQGLEFKVTPGKNVTVEAPTFRPDVTREIDVIEEIARVYGYEKIPVVMRAGGDLVVSRDATAIFTDRLKQTMLG